MPGVSMPRSPSLFATWVTMYPTWGWLAHRVEAQCTSFGLCPTCDPPMGQGELWLTHFIGKSILGRLLPKCMYLWMLFTVQAANLSCWLDTLPNAEVADDPGQDETQDQFPPQAPHLLDTTRDFQNPTPGERSEAMLRGRGKAKNEWQVKRNGKIIIGRGENWVTGGEGEKIRGRLKQV